MKTDLFEERHVDDVTIRKFLLMINLFNVSHMLSWVFSIGDCRRCKNLMKTSVTHSAAPGLLLFCSYLILMSSVICY